MKNKFRWYKWRQYTAGAIGEWKYICVPSYLTGESVKEYLDHKGLLDTWSEHFRRVVIKSISTKIPEKILEDNIKEITARMNDLESKRVWLYGQHKKKT